MNQASKDLLEWLDAKLAVLEKRGVASANFDGSALTSVTFHAPAPPPVATDPTESNPERDDAVAASAIALAGRTRRQTANEP